MDFLDRLIELNFEQDVEGRELFFPHGVWSHGYVVPTRDAADAIRTFLRRYHSIVLAILFVSVVLMRGYALLLVPVVLILYPFLIRTQTRGLERSAERRKFRDVLKRRAKVFGWGQVVLGLLGSTLFVVLGIALSHKMPWWQVWLPAGFFGLCSVGYLVIAAIKLKSAHDEGSIESLSSRDGT